MAIEDRILTLRQALADLAVCTEETYPDLRASILAAGGDGFAEGVRMSMFPTFSEDPDNGEVIESPPDETQVSIGGLTACLKGTLQIALSVQWLGWVPLAST